MPDASLGLSSTAPKALSGNIWLFIKLLVLVERQD